MAAELALGRIMYLDIIVFGFDIKQIAYVDGNLQVAVVVRYVDEVAAVAAYGIPMAMPVTRKAFGYVLKKHEIQ